jgi:hypothetical protein
MLPRDIVAKTTFVVIAANTTPPSIMARFREWNRINADTSGK